MRFNSQVKHHQGSLVGFLVSANYTVLNHQEPLLHGISLLAKQCSLLVPSSAACLCQAVQTPQQTLPGELVGTRGDSLLVLETVLIR